MKPIPTIAAILATGILALHGAEKMPREDVIDVPAISDGLCVSNVFQTNMVLQRAKPVAVWGWAKPGEKVTVSFGKASETATASDDRSWKVTLPAMEANATPRKLTVKGTDKSLTLENILVGDVWVLGGQSNMEWPMGNSENGNLEIISANYPEIRILTIPSLSSPEKGKSFPRLHQWSDWSSRHFRKGDWDVCSPEIVKELSAIGYVFARRIHMASEVPIGVVDVSVGGTTVETWTPMPVIRKFDAPEVKAMLEVWDTKIAEWDPKADLEKRVQRHNQKIAQLEKEGKTVPANMTVPTDLKPGPAMDKNRAGNCYAAMIGPLEGLAVKGAIFHQGFNNCFSGTDGAIMYRHVFPKMITAWREAFGDPQMPFGILSLCTAGAVQTTENFSEAMADLGPFIREAQYQTFLEFYEAGDKNIGFVSTYDLRRKFYHPQLKVPAGERAARWALATQYGFEKEIRWKPPIVKEVLAKGDHLQLNLDEAAEAIDDGSPIQGFAIAGEDRIFHPAEAAHLVTGQDDRGRDKTEKKSIVLTSHMVPKPVHFRYAWARSPLANLQASRLVDIPFGTQRSDDWAMEQTPVIPTEGEPNPRADRRKIQEALRKADLDRHLKEAKNLIEANE